MNNSLIQSRLYETPIIGDISKAYLRIRVSQFESEKHDENNEVDENIPFLGLLWNRKTDTIKFNGSFTLTKKNRMGQSKNLDISQIDKKFLKILTGLKIMLPNGSYYV